MNDASESSPIRILWTGGFDSSYRMVQLSRRMVQIQPYYLRDHRRSEPLELDSIAEITKDIQGHPETRCTVLPLVTCRVDDIAPDREITRAYRNLRRTTNIGSQYDWLARFAKAFDGLELCLEKADSSKALNCILKYGALKLQDEAANGSYCVIDAHRSSKDLLRVFGRFRYPIIQKTKLEMIEDFKRLGFEQTMHKTWFCFTPIDGKPCGRCNPCKSVIEEGLSFRLTEAALHRYENRPQSSVVQRTVRAVLSRLHIIELAEDIWKMQAKRRRRSS